MDDREPYKLLMLTAWKELTTSTQRRDVLSYWRLAGIHGMSWPYNGVNAPSDGFCKHRSSDFGPWHRAYMKMFEDALIKTCQDVAERIEDRSVRRQYTSLASSCRLPYWDWTRPNLPSLLTASTVLVLDESGAEVETRNPFTPYQYVASTGTGRQAGAILKRARNWASAMSNSAGQFGRQLSSFVRSGTWRCTYTNSRTCFGNLEQVHNDIHNILGGTGGEMATILYAGFDPLFWLHHCQLDRALWLFQKNSPQWVGAENYTPFHTIRGILSETEALGYYYAGGSTMSMPSRGQMLALESGESSASESSSPRVDAKTVVRAALHEWSGNYTGYAWAVRFQELNEHQLELPTHVYVFLDRPGAKIAALPAKVEEFNDLRMHPNYCGSASGFNDYVQGHNHANTVVNRAVDLTDCLLKAAVDPNVAPANPEDLSRGPSKVPVRLSDLKFVAVDAEGTDVTERYNFGKPVISWSLPVTRTVGQVKAALAQEDPSEAQALAVSPEDDLAETYFIAHGDVHDEL